MTRIVTGDTQVALWHRLVRDAEARLPNALDEELESYLVFTLMRHAQNGNLGRGAVAFDYLSSLQEAGLLREGRLRDVGDHCLLLAGLYPEQAERRMVPLSYFLDIGRGAYRELADSVAQGLSRLYRQLCQAFASMVEVLLELRGMSGWDGLSPLAAAELCQAGGRTEQRFPDRVVAGPARRIQ